VLQPRRSHRAEGMSDGPLVSAVVVSYNACAHLRDCLQSIETDARTVVGEVIVVDNNSHDGSPEMVQSEFPSVILIGNEENVGFGIANNQGTAIATGHYVLLLNSDTRVNAAAVRELVSAMECDPGVGLVGPRLLNADGSIQRSAAPFLTPFNLALDQLGVAREPRERSWQTDPARGRSLAGYLKGAALLGRTEVLRRFGPFDPEFFMYCEDIDLCYRLQRAGLRVKLVPEAVIIHVGGQSSKRNYEAMAVQAIASTYLFYRKHYGRLALVLAVGIVRGVSVLKWLRDGVRYISARARQCRAEESRWRRDMQVWLRITALRPPPVPTVVRA
jgi:GT2 family glycosyltransferase